MRRIAVLSQRQNLPSLIAGSLQQWGSVTAVWEQSLRRTSDASAGRCGMNMPPASGEDFARCGSPTGSCGAGGTAAGGADCAHKSTLSGSAGIYYGDCDFFVSGASTAERLSMAANCQSADILAAADCRTSRLQPADSVIPIIAADSRRLRRAMCRGIHTAICCGTGRSDTVTISSIGSDRYLITLQRELQTLTGGTVDPCDIRVELPCANIGMMDALICSAVLLLCGCPVENGYTLRYM